ncbi:unnamed protein product [Lactuca saligna]|uniref:Uncharacterized protein n=1 Tax=Lactuca saligna TaxID=75948 RepID=A0AA35VN33_LACSI|nr:unnamed protein product [Lactuca saligna]
MPTPNGNSMLCHLMMLHEVRDVEVARAGKFRFELQGRVVKYGETEFCLISGLRLGQYVDIINTKVNTNSTLRNRLLPNVRDEELRLKNLEDYNKGPAFSMCSAEDAVMVMQMMFLLRGLIGRDGNTCIPPAMYMLADSQYNWNMFAWGMYLWRYNETQLRFWFGKIYMYLRDNESVGYTKMMKYTVTGFQLPFKENNIPRVFEPTPVEIHLSFLVRYINWTLDKVQSPPQPQSPPKERSSSPQQQSPPKQRPPLPHPSQFQGANYTSSSHF